ncbi:ABC transporter ATP-binding protein [Alicyclobacillus acidiphilus]|uniref:ABC transporter ATP-binding protein n=1 Tax=Alicyclobacillus acidiphilus TaxID=182455 RepID=UPI00082E49FF|nr:ABC transporter ATP-binding protein [Alicyclobacillus acidiphilus]
MSAMRQNVPTIEPQRLGAPLVLQNVHKRFVQGGRVSHVLRGADLQVGASEIVALVGESGSGKSTLARTIMRLYTPDEGSLMFDGRDVTTARGRDLREYRQRVQMVFQDPFASLNPTHSVRTILKRSLPPRLQSLRDKERDDLFRDALEKVGLTPPDNFLQQFPHELSGGQRQRVALARSLAGRPDLVLADEPVSMLDVSLRLGVLNLMLSLNEQYGIGYLYITHDLASARYVGARIAVMYAGDIVEEGPADTIVEEAKHPYTQLLIQAAPDPDRRGVDDLDSAVFTGEPPNLSMEIQGCPFQFRCPHVMDKCRKEVPMKRPVGDGQLVKCHLYA